MCNECNKKRKTKNKKKKTETKLQQKRKIKSTENCNTKNVKVFENVMRSSASSAAYKHNRVCRTFTKCPSQSGKWCILIAQKVVCLHKNLPSLLLNAKRSVICCSIVKGRRQFQAKEGGINATFTHSKCKPQIFSAPTRLCSHRRLMYMHLGIL